MKLATRVLAVVATVTGIVLPSWAATTSASFTVGATVAGACSVSATSFNFGNALPNAVTSNVDAQGSVRAMCGAGTPYTIALNAGGGAGATFAARRMRVQSGSATLAYSLYTDVARTTLWGDGSAGTSVVTSTASGTPQVIPVYGRIPGGQTVPNGLYFDTITVSLTF